MVAHNAGYCTIFAYENSPDALAVLQQINSLAQLLRGKLVKPLLIQPCDAPAMEDAVSTYGVQGAAVFMALPSKQVVPGPNIVGYLTTDGIRRQVAFGERVKEGQTQQARGPMLPQISSDPMEDAISSIGAGRGTDDPEEQARLANMQKPRLPDAAAPVSSQWTSAPPATPAFAGGGTYRPPTSSYDSGDLMRQAMPSTGKRSSNEQLSMIQGEVRGIGAAASQRMVDTTSTDNMIGNYFTSIGRK